MLVWDKDGSPDTRDSPPSCVRAFLFQEHLVILHQVGADMIWVAFFFSLFSLGVAIGAALDARRTWLELKQREEDGWA